MRQRSFIFIIIIVFISISISITSAALQANAAHVVTELQQFGAGNLTESTQIFGHRDDDHDDDNDNYKAVNNDGVGSDDDDDDDDGDDSAGYNQVDAIIIGNRTFGKKQKQNRNENVNVHVHANGKLSLLPCAPLPPLSVRVSNEVESLGQSNISNIELNSANDSMTTTATTTTATTTAYNNLMRQSVPQAQRHKFDDQPQQEIDRKFGNSNCNASLSQSDTLSGIHAVLTQPHDVSSSVQAKLAVNAGAEAELEMAVEGETEAEFDDEQLLRLQDYNLLFNAERHTHFQLHTNLTAFRLKRKAATTTSASILRMSRGRVRGRQQRSFYNIVGNTLNAAFGLNAGQMLANDELQVETVPLYDAITLRQTRFNPFKPTRILIHGWLGNANANMYATLVPAYLQQLHTGDYNIITVDWGRGALADYITASYRVKPVGKVLAKFIDFLHQETGMRFEDLQLIGFSMGAHIAGIAGKHVQTGRLRVIRALDPALPFFRYAAEAERVSRNDAAYVEVLHTSVGSYGFDRPIGHADFYANWGSSQPGCFWNECSHWRAFQLFAESLRSETVQASKQRLRQRQWQRQKRWQQQHINSQFMAKSCAPEDWQQLTRNKRCPRPIDRQQGMGGDLTKMNARGEMVAMLNLKARHGVYYFETNANSPYAIG